MVSILPGNARTAMDAVGNIVSEGIARNAPGAIQQGYNRGQLQNSLEQIRSISNNPNSTPLDMTLAALQAGAGIPGSERYLGQLIPMLQANAAAQAQQRSSYGTSGQQQNREQPPAQMAPQPAQVPQSVGQKNQNFPTNIGPQGGPGQVPQKATTGQKIPVPTPSQINDDAKKLAADRTAAGIPTTPQEAIEEVKQNVQRIRDHNKEVDNELEQRKNSQKEYGEKAVEKLLKVDKLATDEMQAVFKRLGEQASKRGESEGEIDQYLSKEAVKFKNAVNNATNDLSAPRLYNEMQRRIDGSYKDFEKAGSDIRRHLQPILDLGLYDTARNILSQKGYGAEETDMIINPLSEHSKSIVNQYPSTQPKRAPTPHTYAQEYHRQPADLSNITSALSEMKKTDPNFSLVLARKAFEDKGYDWREFKDALNSLQNQGFELTDDQRIQQGILDTPPLSRIQDVLHGLKLIGR